MSDLTRWLRTYWSDDYDGPPMASDELGRKAADEIERLTESNAIWQEVAKEVTDVAGVNTLIHVPAEIERLRAVVDAARDFVVNNHMDYDDAMRIFDALAALEDDDECEG